MKRQALVFLLFLSMMPLVTIAQNKEARGGLFGRGPASNIFESEYSNSGGLFTPTWGGYNISTQQFGSDFNGGYNISTQQFGYDEVPLGCGCLVLTLAGAAYVMKKRKNNPKK